LEVLGYHLCHNITSLRSPLVHLKLAPPRGNESNKKMFWWSWLVTKMNPFWPHNEHLYVWNY
jgi:hypothetical protein